MSRYSSNINTYGEETVQIIESSRVLIIGAGGIGCEILKNLALLGFPYIELIDLDTIDVSNLNRQFLFRSEHVGQSKALIAAEATKKFNPDITIIPHHANIKDPTFSSSYFQKFNIVLNALDNVEARKHVNRLCLSAGVPLIDSGTTGFSGQVKPIIKGKTACYECFPKPTPKVYPVCTIRSTPDKPVHCIVWGKELFKLIFGNPHDSMLYEDTALTNDSTYMHLLALPKELSTTSIVNYSKSIIKALYVDEISKCISMEMYKTAAKTPETISIDLIESGANHSTKYIDKLQTNRPSSVIGWDNKIWSIEECVTEIILCIYEASQIDSKSGKSLIGQLTFDKDDALAMKFVYAASNLRCAVFGIPLSSFHDTKGIAGNIIPAISTTNAIIAGIQVFQAVKILKDSTSPLKDVYCSRCPTRKGVYLLPSNPDKPNEKGCCVCSTAILQLKVDTNSFIFNDFINKVLKAKLGFIRPSVTIGSSVIYEDLSDENSDDYEDEIQFYQKNLLLTLDRCPGGGLHHDTSVFITDSVSNVKMNLIVKQATNEELEKLSEDVAIDRFQLSGGNLPDIIAQQTTSESKPEEDDEYIEVLNIDTKDHDVNKKRPLEEHDSNTTLTLKKQKND
eukprot:gene19590-25493_t